MNSLTETLVLAFAKEGAKREEKRKKPIFSSYFAGVAGAGLGAGVGERIQLRLREILRRPQNLTLRGATYGLRGKVKPLSKVRPLKGVPIALAILGAATGIGMGELVNRIFGRTMKPSWAGKEK